MQGSLSFQDVKAMVGNHFPVFFTYKNLFLRQVSKKTLRTYRQRKIKYLQRSKIDKRLYSG